MRKRLLALLPLAGVLSGQDPLSLKDAVRMALERNKAIEAALASQDAAAARITQAHSGLLPKVNYAESWTRSDNPGFVFSSLLAQRQFSAANFAIPTLNRPDFLNNFQSLVTADQPLYDAGKTRRAVRMAELAKSATGEELRRHRMELIAQVVRVYYGAQLSASQLRVTEEAMKSAEADLQRAENRRASGMATDADVLSIRVHLAAVREEQIRRTADLDVAHAAVNDALAMPLDTGYRLTTGLAPLTLPADNPGALEESGLSDRPEARQLRLAKDLAGVQVSDARGAMLPQVALRGAFEADRQRFYNRAGANWLVSIGLRWNLFNGYADKARIAETEAALRRTTAEQARAESAIRLQVRRAWAELTAAQARIEAARASVTEAEESLRISQNRFGAGLHTVTDLLRTETALLQTQTRHLAAIHDQRVAAALLELAAGTLHSESEVLN